MLEELEMEVWQVWDEFGGLVELTSEDKALTYQSMLDWQGINSTLSHQVAA